jgi:hypothetical protein
VTKVSSAVRAHLAGYQNGSINDVASDYVDGSTIDICGTVRDDGLESGATGRIARRFDWLVDEVAHLAFEWEEVAGSPGDLDFTPAGGAGTVDLRVLCEWTASSNNDWITITAGTSGDGDGTIQIAVAPNSTGLPRDGSITVATLNPDPPGRHHRATADSDHRYGDAA